MQQQWRRCNNGENDGALETKSSSRRAAVVWHGTVTYTSGFQRERWCVFVFCDYVVIYKCINVWIVSCYHHLNSCFCQITLLVGWQRRHPARKKPAVAVPKGTPWGPGLTSSNSGKVGSSSRTTVVVSNSWLIVVICGHLAELSWVINLICNL